MRRARVLSFLTAAGLATAALAWQGSVNQLMFNGQTVSTNLKTVDGTLMVSVKDVAAYLGGDLSVQNGTATIGAGNGANSTFGTPFRAGVNAGAVLPPEPTRPKPAEVATKVGEDADNGGFALRVTGVEEPKGNYKTVNDPRGRHLSPGLKDERLVVVRMRLENRTKETRRPPLPAGLDVTLFDEAGVGVPVAAFDARPVGDPDLDFGLGDDLGAYGTLDAPVLAPGGAFEFAAVFSLPKGRTPTKLAVALPAPTAETGGANVTVRLD